jgi:hypothetical protein
MTYPVVLKDFSRVDFATMLAQLRFNVGAEIGVYEADYSLTLLQANNELKLFCIDPWLPMPEYKDMEASYQIAIKALSGTNAIVIRKSSKDAIQDFEYESLDFVYIDGDHTLEGASFDIDNWSRVVRPGGIVAGHDFEDYWSTNAKNYKVKEAVTNYVDANNIEPWYIFDGRPDYVKGKTKRIPKSWMWIKE